MTSSFLQNGARIKQGIHQGSLFFIGSNRWISSVKKTAGRNLQKIKDGKEYNKTEQEDKHIFPEKAAYVVL